MRSQYYADSRDVWKWTVVEEAAARPGAERSVFWAALLRPDEANGHGNDHTRVSDAHTTVAAFFDEERERLATGAPRELARTGKLFAQLGRGFDAYLEPYGTSVGARGLYVDGLIERLEARPGARRDVLLLDPDTGLGSAPKNGLQLHETHARPIWDALRAGDVYVLFQYQLRVRNWIGVVRARLGNLLGVPVARIETRRWGPVCFYVVER